MKRLGYLSFDNNERSGHQARELKSVHVSTPAFLLKLVVQRCHTNRLNIYNQVQTSPGLLYLCYFQGHSSTPPQVGACCLCQSAAAAPPPQAAESTMQGFQPRQGARCIAADAATMKQQG